jgi:hypothetical protein
MIGITQEIDNFTYSNITETVSLWSPTTEYSFGQLARVGSYHYKSTFGDTSLYNVGNEPLSTLNVNWYKYEPSNLYACLDTLEETTTVWSGTSAILEFERGTKNKIALGNFNATLIKIEALDSLGAVMSDYTQEYTFSNNLDVLDEWTYGYGGFNETFKNVAYYPIRLVGEKVRITMTRGGAAGLFLGYLIAGKAESFGTTHGEVALPDNRIGSRSVNTATFSTFVESYELTRTVQRGKQLIDVDMLFVVDPTDNSKFQNIVILGKITKCDAVASNFDLNEISWTIQQNIRT